jgi:hypothetical protein
MGLFGRLGRPGRAAVRRRAPLPATARDLLGLQQGSTVLAWSSLAGGGWAVATAVGVRALLPTGSVLARPWTDVDHVAWDQDSGMLAVWWVGSRQPTALELEERSFLPEVVHERVRSSLVLARDVPVAGGRTVWVALRKADDGTLSTQAVPARGVRLADPEVAALVARAQAALRDEAGAGPQGGPAGGSATRLGPL